MVTKDVIELLRVAVSYCKRSLHISLSLTMRIDVVGEIEVFLHNEVLEHCKRLTFM